MLEDSARPAAVAQANRLRSKQHADRAREEKHWWAIDRREELGQISGVRADGMKRLAAWYRDNLGMPLEKWGGAILRWPDDRAEDRGLTVWHVAGRDSQWFAPSAASFMINYRVDDLEALLGSLRQKGVEVLKGPEHDENGKFAWILDPDGNKVELWEPKISDEKNKRP